MRLVMTKTLMTCWYVDDGNYDDDDDDDADDNYFEIIGDDVDNDIDC